MGQSVLPPLNQHERESSPANIYLCRHCKTSWNVEGRLQGTVDLLLASSVILTS